MARFSSFVVGAGLMYLLDPDRGNGRRARLRNALVHAGKVEGNLLRKGLRDAQNRAQGVSMRARRVFSEPAPDEVVLGRIRARLGRAVAHAHVHALDIEVTDGRAILRGPVLTAEADEILGCTRGTAGVREVIDRLERHATPAGIRALEHGERRERRRGLWPPSLQVGAIGAGALLAGYGLLVRRGVVGGVLGAAGGALVARAMLNEPLPALVGQRGAEVMVQKTVIVHAPIRKVFDLWSHFENFPRFMRHVREIEVTDRTSQWTVEGPAHTTVSFEAETIELKPEQVIAWRTLAGQQLDHEGRVRFEPVGDDATRVTVRMSYRPPGGVLGHAIAHILGWDPKSRIDDDLVRMKSLLEEGKARSVGERAPLTEFH